MPLPEAASRVLDASYAARVDVITVDELSAEIARCVHEILTANPGRRLRLKAIGGGGGKGQRILSGIDRDGRGDARARAQGGGAERSSAR